jgi:hypothetical protein
LVSTITKANSQTASGKLPTDKYKKVTTGDLGPYFSMPVSEWKSLLLPVGHNVNFNACRSSKLILFFLNNENNSEETFQKYEGTNQNALDLCELHSEGL